MTSLYIHIPFCKNKCLYCSFVIAVGKQNYIDPYLECMAKEAEYYKGSEVETIYLGGGTPTFINVTQIVRLFEIIRANFKFAKGCEFTIEANPENIDVAKAELLRGLGINRISLGVQSLNDKYLKYLGRPHDRRGALIAFEHLRQAGFANINLDLMFSFPRQTLDEIEEDVRSIALLKSEHLSLYSLTIEEGSRFFREKVELDNDVCRAEHYLRIVEMLGEEGFEQYEISNFSKPGKQSRHNRNYWEGGNYIGLGVGAHSHQNGRRYWNTSNFNDYLSKTKERTPVDGEENLAAAERLMEALLFGLRMNEGVVVNILEERFREALSPDKKAIINELLKQGLLAEDKSRLKTTPEGRLVLDEISSRLI